MSHTGITAIFFVFVLTVATSKYFDMQPSSMEVMQGDTADLDCKINRDYMTSNYKVEWFKDGNLLYIASSPRISYLDSTPLLNGLHSIRIHDIRMLENDGNYVCRYFQPLNVTQETDPATVTVIVQPKPVQMFLNDVEIQTEEVTVMANNSEAAFKCIVTDSHPTAEIKWYLGEEDVSLYSIQENSVDSLTHLVTSVSTLNRVFTTGNNDKFIYCHVVVATFPVSTPNIVLDIHYPPQNASLSIISGSSDAILGSTLELKCECDANPEATYAWKQDGNTLPDTGPILKIQEVKYRHAGIYECQAENVLGSRSSNIANISVGDAFADLKHPFLPPHSMIAAMVTRAVQKEMEKWNQGFENKFYELDKRIKVLENTTTGATIQEHALGFSAHGLASSTGSGTSVMKFRYIHTNIGNAYSSSTGKFMAPSPGTYSFEAHLRVTYTNTRGSNYVATLTLNGNYITYFVHPGDGKLHMLSNSAILNLKSGDEVYIIYRGGSFSTSSYQCTFSGYLVGV